MDASVVTLNITPKTAAAEEIIRKTGSTPRTVMRVLNNSLVAKLYEHLMGKWKLSVESIDGELVLYCKDTKMLLTDEISVFQESSVSLRLSIEYDIVSSLPVDESTTAASTPVASTLPPQDEAESLVLPNQPLTLSDKKPKTTTTGSVVDKRSSKKKASGTAAEQHVDLPVDIKRCRLSLDTRIGTTQTVASVEAPSTSTLDKVESLYREMLDRERDLFKWVSNMLNTFISSGIVPPKGPF
jgi:hypothetical protein